MKIIESNPSNQTCELKLIEEINNAGFDNFVAKLLGLKEK